LYNGVVHQNDIEFPLRDTKSNLFADRRKKAFQGVFNVMPVVGSKSLWQEVELVAFMIWFYRFGLKGATVKINIENLSV
jgi:hypothetical protein